MAKKEKKVKVNISEIELDKELVDKIKKLGHTPQSAISEVLESKLWRAVNRTERDEEQKRYVKRNIACKKCGKIKVSGWSSGMLSQQYGRCDCK